MELELIHFISQLIYDKKGYNILGLDLSGISSITDTLLIAEATAERHVISIAKTIIKEMKKKNERPIRTEGLDSGDWVVLDYVDVMIHIFMPGLRDKYQLEKLFPEGKLIDLNIITAKKNEKIS